MYILTLFLLSQFFAGTLICVEQELQQQVHNQEMTQKFNRLSDEALRKIEADLDTYRLSVHKYQYDFMREHLKEAQENLEILKQHNYLSPEILGDYEYVIGFAKWVLQPDGSVIEPAMMPMEWDRLIQFTKKAVHAENDIKRARKDLNLLKELHSAECSVQFDVFERAIECAEHVLKFQK